MPTTRGLDNRGCSGARLSLVVAGVLLAALALARPEPAAVITQLTGRGQIVAASGGKAPATTGAVLYPRDRLQLAKGSSVTLAYPDRPAVVALGGPNGNTIAFGRGVSAQEGSLVSRLWKHLLASLLPPVRPDIHAASRAVIGEVNNRPHGLRPVDSRERSLPLQFDWLPLPGATYTVVVLDGKGNELWQSGSLLGPPCPYPAEAPALQPGERYWWEVRAQANNRETASPAYWFELLPASAINALSADLAKLNELTGQAVGPVARHVQKATLLASYGLRGEAGAEANLARELRPQDQALSLMLQRVVEAASAPSSTL